MGKNIFIVMPAYNAEKTISSVFDRIPEEIYDKVSKIIVVNDGSTDSTEKVVRELKEKYQKIKLVNHRENRGYAQAQKTAYSIALEEGADIAAMLHADGQYSPEVMPRLLKPLENGRADVVLGSRMLSRKGPLAGGMPLYKYIGNKFLTFIENIFYHLFFGLNLSEYHSGYMLYSRKALETIDFRKLTDSFHFDGEMLLRAGKNNLRVKELPIPTTYADEESHLNPIKYGFNVLKVLFKNIIR